MSTNHWQVDTCEISERAPGLVYIQGVNHHQRDTANATFHWHIGHHSVCHPEYDWSKTTFAPGARERLETLRALAEPKVVHEFTDENGARHRTTILGA